jgi:hypothetical protein
MAELGSAAPTAGGLCPWLCPLWLCPSVLTLQTGRQMSRSGDKHLHALLDCVPFADFLLLTWWIYDSTRIVLICRSAGRKAVGKVLEKSLDLHTCQPLRILEYAKFGTQLDVTHKRGFPGINAPRRFQPKLVTVKISSYPSLRWVTWTEHKTTSS